MNPAKQALEPRKAEALYGGGVSYFTDYKWDVILYVN